MDVDGYPRSTRAWPAQSGWPRIWAESGCTSSGVVGGQFRYLFPQVANPSGKLLRTWIR